MKKTFEGRGARVENETGSWGYSSDRVVLVLRSNLETWSFFSLPRAGVLRAVDAKGQSIGLKAPADLQRTDAAPAKTVQVPVAYPEDTVTVSLSGVEWKLTELENEPVRPADKYHRDIKLAFDEGTRTFSGVSGCNNLSGTFTASWRTMTLAPREPLRICRADQGTERALSRTLKAARSYRITGAILDLFNDQGTRIARFEGRITPGSR